MKLIDRLFNRRRPYPGEVWVRDDGDQEVIVGSVSRNGIMSYRLKSITVVEQPNSWTTVSCFLRTHSPL